VGVDGEYEDLGPGVHVLREGSPLKRAGTLAANLRGELCATLPQAEAALRERGALPRLGPADLVALRALAARVARTARIAAGTRARAKHELGRRLTETGTGVAVHPDTVRERAAAVTSARVALDDAAHALEAHDAVTAERARAAADVDAAPADASVPHPVLSAARDRAGWGARRSQAVGAIAAGFGVGMILLATGAVPLYVALVPALAGCVWALRHLRPEAGRGDARDDDAGDDDRAAVSSRLAEVSAATDEAFGARRASLADGEQALLQARRRRCEEDLRVAERAWADLAGEDVDVSELEAVVRRFDPQHAAAERLAGETAGVRAVGAILYETLQRWTESWGSVGMDAPPPAGGEAAVDDLARRISRAIVLVGPAAERAEDLAAAAPAAPVIVLDGPLES